MKKVLVAGAFDLLHPGHMDFFRQAKLEGDELVVVVARDSTVAKLKGQKPHYPEQHRLHSVASNSYVDRARLGNEEAGLFDVVSEEMPDVVVLGYDQLVEEPVLEEAARKAGLRVRVVRAKAFAPEQFKSSHLKAVLGI